MKFEKDTYDFYQKTAKNDNFQKGTPYVLFYILAKGLPVDGEYFSAKMRMLVKRDYPNAKFTGSDNWIQKFTRRFGISLQCKTNKKSKSIEERLPKVRNFHWRAVFQMALEEA